MISVYRWDAGKSAGRWLSADEGRGLAAPASDSADVFWVDLDDPSPEEEAFVFQQFFRVHPLTLEDVTKLRREPAVRPHFPKVEEFADYLFVVVNPLSRPFLDL